MAMAAERREEGAVAAEPLLAVADLRTYFDLRHGIVKAVDGVGFMLNPGETLAIVGESGCGKSITALSLMRLVPDPPGRIASGSPGLSVKPTPSTALTMPWRRSK
jgi:ABC-type dipeptide/oligopeptide/nickel transport system ATPase component